jgi:phenylacetate-CoA ligase
VSESWRHPLIDGAGRALLRSILEHPNAPIWNHTCGERLDAAGLAAVRSFAALVGTQPPTWGPRGEPAWVAGFVERCLATVPFYKQHGPGRRPLSQLPPTSRSDIANAPWAFVPDGEPLEDLTLHGTSGTGGHAAPVLQTPVVIASYYPLVEAVLAAHGVELPGLSARRVGWMTVAWQSDTYVLASVSAYLGGTGTAKVNLHPAAWRDPADRALFLSFCDPAVVTGDPVALAALAELPAELRPLALISSASALMPALAERLRRRLGSPVIDIFSAAEIGPLAYALPDDGAHALVQPNLYVEVLDRAGAPCEPGVVGEVTVTGGFNPLLPLLRYRTGDRAALTWRGRRPVLTSLEGRAAVRLETDAGVPVNTVDVTKSLAHLPLGRWSVHQFADRSVRVQIPDPSGPDASGVRSALAGVLGSGTPVAVEGFESDAKVPAFTSDLAGLSS